MALSTSARVAALCSLLSACGGAAAPAVAPASAPAAGVADAERAFASLGALVGDWEAPTAKGGTLHVSYRLMSHGSVLVETWGNPGKQTITVFHRDGARLLATHYCAQGNQPRLALSPAAQAREPGVFDFAFTDVTNLERPGASRMVRLRLALQGAEHFDMTEIYEEDGKPDTTRYAFTRRLGSPGGPSQGPAN